MICSLCPRNCGKERREREGDGFCRAGMLPKIAKAALHHWEEPCISGKRGSGTVFFSGCNLGCVFCQNYKLSHEDYGEIVSIRRLAGIFSELEEQGAHNITLSHQPTMSLQSAKPWHWPGRVFRWYITAAVMKKRKRWSCCGAILTFI